MRKREEPDEIVNSFDFAFNRSDAKDITYDDLFSLIKGDVCDDYYEAIESTLRRQLGRTATDSEKHEEYGIFAVPAKDGYGVYLFQVRRINDQGIQELRLQKGPCYYGFESDSLMTFFDGKR